MVGCFVDFLPQIVYVSSSLFALFANASGTGVLLRQGNEPSECRLFDQTGGLAVDPGVFVGPVDVRGRCRRNLS